MRQRTIIDADAVVSWAAGVRLRFHEGRQAWLLMAPERVLMPDGVALDIMRRVDGQRSVGTIIQELCDDYDAQAQELRLDTLEFLQELADRGYVTR